MGESSINPINKTPAVPDALKKQEQEQRSRPALKKKAKIKKDPKRIIDTYA